MTLPAVRYASRSAPVATSPSSRQRPSTQLAAIRSKAVATAGVFVADMPSAAQSTRVYDEYLEQVSTTGTDQLSYCAVSVTGPRNTVDKMVRKLALLT